MEGSRGMQYLIAGGWEVVYGAEGVGGEKNQRDGVMVDGAREGWVHYTPNPISPISYSQPPHPLIFTWYLSYSSDVSVLFSFKASAIACAPTSVILLLQRLQQGESYTSCY